MRKHFKKSFLTVILTALFFALTVAACFADEGDNFSDFVGVWKYEEQDIYLAIYEDEDYRLFESDGNVILKKSCDLDEGKLTLYDKDYGTLLEISLTFDGRLMDSNSKYLARYTPERQEIPTDNISINDFFGAWYSKDYGEYWLLYDDCVYQKVEDDATHEVSSYGCFRLEENTLVLFDFTDDEIKRFSFEEDGILRDDDDDIFEFTGLDPKLFGNPEINKLFRYVGFWQIEDNSTLHIGMNGSWEMQNADGEEINAGSVRQFSGEKGLVLLSDNDELLEFPLNADGELTDTNGNIMLKIKTALGDEIK